MAVLADVVRTLVVAEPMFAPVVVLVFVINVVFDVVAVAVIDVVFVVGAVVMILLWGNIKPPV